MQRLRRILCFTALSGVLLLVACNLASSILQPTVISQPPATSMTMPPMSQPASTQIPDTLPTTLLSTQLPRTQVPGNVWVVPCLQNPSKYCYQFEIEADSWEVVPQEYSWSPKLVHRTVAGCEITPQGGMGLPDYLTVERTFRTVGMVQYLEYQVRQEGELVYIKYWPLVEGDSFGFGVAFQNYQDTCIQDAEAVLATLIVLTTNPKG